MAARELDVLADILGQISQIHQFKDRQHSVHKIYNVALQLFSHRFDLVEQVKGGVSGIDAPGKAQAFGSRSKQGLSDCAFAKQVQLGVIKLDRYGRSVGKLISQGTDCGLRQIELGLAWHYKAFARDQSFADRQSYAAAENRAHERKLGLWSDLAAIPPWEFRRSK